MKYNIKGFSIYYDWIERLKDIEPDRAFYMICVLSDYYRTGEDPTTKFEGTEKALIGIMFDQVKRAETLSDVRSESGRAGGLAKANSSKGKQILANSSKEIANPSYSNSNNNSNIIKEEIYKEESTQKTRHKYGQYNNVLLSDEELKKLKSEFPDDWQARIERVSEYVASTGKSYKNFLAVIRTWAKNEKQSSQKEKGADNATGQPIRRYDGITYV